MDNDFSRGSEWRKWDLHLHTASSYDAYKGNDADDILCKQIEENNISVVAITDHFVIDKSRIENLKNKVQNTVFFPGVELRTDKGSCNIHIILLFAPEIDLKNLEEDFNAFKRSKAKNQENDETIYWDFSDIKEFAKEHKALMSLHAGGKDKGIDDKIKNHTDFQRAVKEEYANVIDIFEVSKLKDVEDYKRIVFPNIKFQKPLIICSDNHNPNDYIKNHRDIWLWIKADTTFEGLKQILQEPEGRVYVGGEPPILSNISNNKTKYIDTLSIKPVSDYDNNFGEWFNNEIKFNKELVAIIGNKGNGKSAIADIIANCCDCHEQQYFSFLNENKFRDGKIAQHFEATVTFKSGTSYSKNLNTHDVAENQALVKYLPQGYFESICNDLQKEKNLNKEIETVVFQYIDDAEKLGASSFSELISKKTEITKQQIEVLKGKLAQINEEIIGLERKENNSYLAKINSDIKQKEEELKALEEPKVVNAPNNNTKETKDTIEKINNLQETQKKLLVTIDEKKISQNNLAVEIENIKNFLSKLDNLTSYLSEFKENNKKYATTLGLNIDEIVKFEISRNGLEAICFKKETEYTKLNNILSTNSSDDSNLINQINKLNQEIENYEQKLEEPQKEYQLYLKKKEEYENAKKIITGDENTPQTLKWYQKEKQYIETALVSDLEQKYEERRSIVRQIYKNKQDIENVYKAIKSRIDEKIKESKILLEEYEINIDSSLFIKNDFVNNILYYMKQNIRGSFKGKQEGEIVLRKIIKEHSIEDENGMIALCDEIIDKLKHDCTKNNERRFVDEQITNMQMFYDYLFSLNYVDYNYQLKLGKKSLSLLSPGEKGALLLIFYLLLDMDNKPLILDQPEDNLDNNSVAKILVRFIKNAKKQRQIIMVTHNPNLAVVADAEQIIYVNIDKQNQCKFTVESGSIENPVINKHIVDVLEGAMPAFRKRDDKYIKQ
ncbi:MAG: hypothetical protein HDR37_12100 [Treponema sp.]|nr:hypothetical protein [Treponema sp.]